MIINIRWPHACKGKVRPNTITELGAEYVCSKCFKIFYRSWSSLAEMHRAKVYLLIKETDKQLRDMGLDI